MIKKYLLEEQEIEKLKKASRELTEAIHTYKPSPGVVMIMKNIIKDLKSITEEK